MHHARTEPRAAFFGWRVVAATFVLAMFGWGIGFYGPPVFLHAVVERTGWPVAFVSAAITLHYLAGAVLVANLPRLYQRLGIPACTMLGAISLAAGMLGWGLAARPVELLAAAVATGFGWVTLSAAAINAILASWFVRDRPKALSMAYNGASVGGLVFSPLWVVLISGLGFPIAAAAVGIALLVIVAIACLAVLRVTPASLGVGPDGGPPETAPDRTGPTNAIAANANPPRNGWDRRLLTLSAAMTLALFAQIGLVSHLFSLLAPALGIGGTGILMGLATGSAILGRTALGWLIRPGDDRRVYACLSYAVQIVGGMVLVAAGAGEPLLLIIGTLLIGVGIGNATSLPPLIAQAEFARTDVAGVVATVVALSQAFYAFAPGAFGLVRALEGELGWPQGRMVFLLAALLQCAAIAAMLAGRSRR